MDKILTISCLMILGLLLPFGRCWGQVLYSSQDPTKPVEWGAGEKQEEGLKLVEPVIPNQNLDVQPAKEETEQGTLYETGMATYYSPKTHGRMMASGERYDKNGLFCAHKKLPFGTKIRVVNKKNGKEVVVVVKDRGPFAKGRIIDLSNKAAEVIGMLSAGVVPVELWIEDNGKSKSEK